MTPKSRCVLSETSQEARCAAMPLCTDAAERLTFEWVDSSRLTCTHVRTCRRGTGGMGHLVQADVSHQTLLRGKCSREEPHFSTQATFVMQSPFDAVARKSPSPFESWPAPRRVTRSPPAYGYSPAASLAWSSSLPADLTPAKPIFRPFTECEGAVDDLLRLDGVGECWHPQR